MHIKQIFWFGVLVAISACAPIPIDSKGYQPSLVEQVLAKKSTSGQLTAQPTAQPATQSFNNQSSENYTAKSKILPSTTDEPSYEAAEAEIIKPRTAAASPDQYLDKMTEQLSAPDPNNSGDNSGNIDNALLNSNTYTTQVSTETVESSSEFSTVTDNTPVEAENIKPALLTTIEKKNSDNEIHRQSTERFFTINEPNVSIINLTGKPLTKLIQKSTFNNDQVNQSLSHHLIQSQLFQLKTNPTDESSYLSKLRSLDQKKSSGPAQPNGDLILEAKLIINQTNDPLIVGATLNLSLFDSDTGDAIADTRTYSALSNNESNLNNLISEAVKELSNELNNH
jgi:hypothetical protein